MPFILYDNMVSKGAATVTATNITDSERLVTPQLSPKATLQNSTDCVIEIVPDASSSVGVIALIGLRYGIQQSPTTDNVSAPIFLESKATQFAPYQAVAPSTYEVIRVAKTPFNDEHIIIKFNGTLSPVAGIKLTISTGLDGDQISIGSVFLGSYLESSELIERISSIGYRSTATKETSSGGQIYTSDGSITRTVRVVQSSLPYWQMNGGLPNPKTLTPLGAPDLVDGGITDSGDYWEGNGTIQWSNVIESGRFHKVSYKSLTTAAVGVSTLGIGVGSLGDNDARIGSASFLVEAVASTGDFDFELTEGGSQELRVYKDFEIEYYEPRDTDEENLIERFLSGGMGRLFAKAGTNQPILVVMATESYMREQTAFYGFINRINEYTYSTNHVSGSFELTETL